MGIYYGPFFDPAGGRCGPGQNLRPQQCRQPSEHTLGTAATNADNLYSQAGSYYTPLVASTTAGSSAYGDATGANGADGLARAKALYQADPGYSGGLTTGIDQVARTAAARGDLGGGNTSADMIKFASDYDNSKYSSYVSALAPYLSANAIAPSAARLASRLGRPALTPESPASSRRTSGMRRPESAMPTQKRISPNTAHRATSGAR
jgi:hypothetical protein